MVQILRKIRSKSLDLRILKILLPVTKLVQHHVMSLSESHGFVMESAPSWTVCRSAPSGRQMLTSAMWGHCGGSIRLGRDLPEREHETYNGGGQAVKKRGYFFLYVLFLYQRCLKNFTFSLELSNFTRKYSWCSSGSILLDTQWCVFFQCMYVCSVPFLDFLIQGFLLSICWILFACVIFTQTTSTFHFLFLIISYFIIFFNFLRGWISLCFSHK